MYSVKEVSISEEVGSLDRVEETSYPTWIYVMISIMTFLWIAAGIVAFIVSLICFGKSGKRIDKVIGLLLAVLFGPFYWIYYMVVKKYCR